MEKTALIIEGTHQEIADGLKRFAILYAQPTPEPKDTLQDRITPKQAMAPDLLDCSWPTFRKMANEGIIKLYGEPRRYYLFRSEVIDAIRSMSFTPKTEKP